MLTVFLILAVAALIMTIANALGKAQLWIAVLFITLIELLRAIPLGR